MTTIGDLVLVYLEEEPVFFARIEDISSDSKRDWFQVRLLVLQVPVIETVWILKQAYINGETFTMNGRRIRIDKVRVPKEPRSQSSPSESEPGEKERSPNNKIISIFDRKKR